MLTIAALLGTITEALICIGLLAWTVHSLLKVIGGPDGSKGYDNYIFNFFTSSLSIAVKYLVSAESQLEPIVNAFKTAVVGQSAPLSNAIDSDIRGMIINAFNAVEKAVTLGKTSEPGDAIKTGAAAMSEAFAFGLESFVVSAAFEACFPEKLNVLNGTGPMLSQLAGFDEVSKALREPLYKNAFGKSAEYYYRSVFKPELPNEKDAVDWHARRFLTDDQLRTIFGYSGLKPEYEDAFVRAAYTSIQPRAMATLFQDVPFDDNEMTSLLERAGLLPEQIPVLLKAFQYNSLKNVRNQYVSAVITAAERGTITAAEVSDDILNIGYSQEALDLINLTISTRKLEQLAEIYRKSVSEAYKYGLVTDADYVTNLEAIGIAAADAQAHYAVDSIAKQGKALLAEERAAAAQARRLEAAAVKAAVEEFRTGTIDGAGLSVALLAAGMDPGIAGFAVAYNELRLQGAQVNVAGKLVSKADAVLLRAQIAAIGNQVIYAKLDENGAQAELIALGIPGNNRQALIAGWIAHGAKLVIPIK